MTGFRNAMMGAAGAAGGGYSVDNSIVLDDGSSQYLSLTPTSTADSDRIGTFSCWVKRGNLGIDTTLIAQARDGVSDDAFFIYFTSSDELRVLCNNDAGAAIIERKTNRLFRDPHAFLHIHVKLDGSQTDDTSCVVTINGVQETSFATKTNPGASTSLELMNTTKAVAIGQLPRASTNYGDFYLSEVFYQDGVAGAATDAGEYDTNGVWRPIDVSGLSFGSAGFYLPFSAGSGANLGANSVSASTFTPAAANYTYNATYLTIGSGTINNNGSPGVSGRLNNPFNGDFTFSFTATAIAGSIFGVFDATELSTFSTGTDDGGLDSMTNSWWYDDGGNGTGGGGTVGNGYFMYGNSSQGTGPIAAGSAVTIERTGSTIKITDDSSDAHSFSQTFSGPVYIMIGHRNITSKSMDYDSVSMNGIQAFAVSGSPTQSSDTPTNVFATLTPIWKGSSVTLAGGNLSYDTSTNFQAAVASMGVTSGKWYWEVDVGSTVGSAEIGFTDQLGLENILSVTDHFDNHGWSFETNTGKTYDHTTTSVAYGSAASSNDVIGVAIDLDNGKSYWSINGTWQNSGDPAAQTNPAHTNLPTDGTMIVPGLATTAAATAHTFNFGSQSPNSGGNADGNGYGDFDYAPPSGFLAVCTANLYTNAAPAIEDGTAYFQATLWTGDGNATKAITQSGNSIFQPDFIWAKRRSSAGVHQLADAVRGTSQVLNSDDTGAEYDVTTDTSGGGLGAPTSNGFGIVSGTADASNLNTSSATHVAWQWKGDGTSGSSNTDGSITSTVNVNDTAGFSIVKWTGTGANGTIGHGMSAAPDLIIGRNYQDAGNRWNVYHSGNTSAPETDYLVLNSTAATVDDATVWNDTAPTASVFSVGTTGHINQSSKTSLAYCFRSIPGYSAFGSYVGNGSSTDGPLVIFDFAPAFLMIKSTGVQQWVMHDNARAPYNERDEILFADDTAAESTSGAVDFLSNGFKIPGSTSGAYNTNGQSYIYMAFAENPFAGSSPATAR